MPPHVFAAPRRRSLDTVAVWSLVLTLLVALIVATPFVSLPPALVKGFVLGAGAIITLALFIFARLSRGNVIFPPYVLVLALWLPALAYGFSALFSGTTFSAALWGTSFEPDTLGFILVVTFLGMLAALLVRRVEHFRSFFTAAFWAFAAVVAIQTLVLLVGQVAPATVSPNFSIVGSYNSLAMFLGLGLVSLLLATRFLDLSRRARLASTVTGVFTLFLLAVANLPLAWTLVALVALGLFVESVMRRNGSTGDADLDDVAVVAESMSESTGGSRSLVVPLVVLAVSLFFLIGGNLGSALASALHASELNVRPSWQSTLAVTRHVYSDAPLFGTGPDTFGNEWLKYRDAALNQTVFWNLDFSSGVGFIPTSFATTGLVGAAAWLLFAGLLLVLGLRMLLRRAPRDPYLRFASVVSFVGATYLFVSAVFDQPGAVMLALLFVFVGLFASLMRHAEQSHQWGIVFSRAPRIGFVVVFTLTLLLLSSVAAAYALVERSVATSELARGLSALNNGNIAVAQSAAQSSISFAPMPETYLLEAEAANAQLGEITSSTTMPAATAQQAFQATLSNGINAALTATQLAPNDYRGWVALGNLYAAAVPFKVSGAYASAKTAYAKAETLDPTNAQIPFAVAQLDIANKDLAAAQADLQKAIALKQNYTSAIFLLSQLEVQTGNVKDALAAAEAANYFTPNNPSILFQIGILSAAQNDLSTADQALAAAVSVNPKFANARYFLAAILAKEGNYSAALAQLQAVAALSSSNQQTVAPLMTALQSNKNPFPANLLSASSTPVKPGA